MADISSEIIDFLSCPECLTRLDETENDLKCSRCSTRYPVIGKAPRFYGLTLEAESKPLDKDIRNPETWTGWRQMNFEYIKRQMQDVKNPSKVLDIGAGPSHFADIFKEHKHFAVDFHPYNGIDVLTDLTKPLPVQSGYFDVVIMSNVLEHIPEPLSLLQEVHRILKTGGKLIMVTPFLIKVHQAPYDYQRYTEYMFRDFFEKIHFEKFSIEKIGNITDIYSIVHRSLTKYLLSETSGARMRHLLIKSLLFIEKIVFYMVLKSAGPETILKQDNMGYPQGYGCTAVK